MAEKVSLRRQHWSNALNTGREPVPRRENSKGKALDGSVLPWLTNRQVQTGGWVRWENS